MRTRRTTSTFVWSAAPDRAFGEDGKISLQSSTGPVVAGGGGTRYGYLRGSLMADTGATATEAACNLVLRASVQVATTVYAERLTDGFRETDTWRTRPGVDESVAVSVTVPAGTPAGTVVSLNMLPLVKPVILGEKKWHGLRLRASSAIQFHSEEPLDRELRPELVVVWSEKPDAPSGLIPSGGLRVGEPSPTFSWDFFDYGGSRSIGKMQMQISTSSTFTGIVYDSGERAVDAPAWTPAAFAATAGVKYWWRVRHADKAGVWCDGWSPTASYIYAPLPDITVTGLNGGVFTDPTPLLAADAPGATGWEVFVYQGRRQVFASEARGSQLRVQVPRKVITRDDRDYDFIFRAFDDLNRVETAGRPAYRSKTVTARFNDDAALARPTNLVAIALSPRPGVELRWDRSSPADRWTVHRGAVLVDTLDTEEVLNGAGGYRFVDTDAAGGDHVYTVRAVENGRSSPSAVAVRVSSSVGGRWLIADDGRMIPIFNDDGEEKEVGLALQERSEEIELASGSTAIQTTGWRGYAGDITNGKLMDAPQGYGTSTLAEAIELVKEIRLAGRCRYAAGFLNIPVRARSVDVVQTEDDVATVSMRLIQDGEEGRNGLLGGWE